MCVCCSINSSCCLQQQVCEKNLKDYNFKVQKASSQALAKSSFTIQLKLKSMHVSKFSVPHKHVYEISPADSRLQCFVRSLNVRQSCFLRLLWARLQPWHLERRIQHQSEMTTWPRWGYAALVDPPLLRLSVSLPLSPDIYIPPYISTVLAHVADHSSELWWVLNY